MENKIIKSCFGNHECLKLFMMYLNHEIYENEYMLPHPILYRQIGFRNSNENELKIINAINNKFMHEAYTKKCLEEIQEKYNNYENSKKELNFSIIQNAKPNIPNDLFLEIRKYIF